MEEIVLRYQDDITPKGYKLCVDELDNETKVGYLVRDDDQDDVYHHMGIARICRVCDEYLIGWLRDTEQEPYIVETFTSIDELFTALDEEIAKH